MFNWQSNGLFASSLYTLRQREGERDCRERDYRDRGGVEINMFNWWSNGLVADQIEISKIYREGELGSRHDNAYET